MGLGRLKTSDLAEVRERRKMRWPLSLKKLLTGEEMDRQVSSDGC